MEHDDEIKGSGNSFDFGDRMQDPRTGRWLSLDRAAQEYPYLSAYVYCNNNPIVYIDPDGKRFYFAAGAANDPDKTGYPKMMLTAFNTAGIQNTVQIAAHGSKSEDVNFTLGENSKQSADKITTTVQSGYVSMGIAGGFYTNSETVKVPTDWRITKAVGDIKADLKKNPLAKGEQFNLSGYSTGSVTMAQAALQLANEGQVIDNLVLIGSPIAEDSQLWKDLQANKNIKKIIRKDIEGDDVKNINKGGSKLKALWNFLTKGEGHPHFKYAFGKDAKKNSDALGKELHDKGVK